MVKTMQQTVLLEAETIGLVSLGQPPNNYWRKCIYGHAFVFFRAGYKLEIKRYLPVS